MTAAAPMFDQWCLLRGYPAFPALPATVAAFVTDCQSIGIEKLWPAICEISQAHIAAGFADPTAGGVVAGAINVMAQIAPPRSWPKELKARFLVMPHDLQLYIAGHEAKRDTEIKRSHSEAAKLRQTLAAIQEPKKEIDGKRASAA